METEFPALQSPDHKVLGTEFCSGYSDDYGEWNTGFYCPQSALSESSQLQAAVSCCGTPTYKYCCTATAINVTVLSEQAITELSSSGFPSAGQEGQPTSASAAAAAEFGPFLIETPFVLSGIVCGAVMTVVFIMFAVCYYCSCCIFHQKRAAAAAASASGLPLPLTAATAGAATAASNLTLYRLGLAGATSARGSSSLSTTTSSSGLGSLGQGPGFTFYSHPPSTIVNMGLSNGNSSSLSSISTPLLELLPLPGVGAGVSGRDFVYSPNQWQTESVYNNSSSGIYSNPSSSTYSYAYAYGYQPPPSSFTVPPGPQQMPPSLYCVLNDNSWCSNGANVRPAAAALLRHPDMPPPMPPCPPPYNYSQQVYGRVNNPITHTQPPRPNPRPPANHHHRTTASTSRAGPGLGLPPTPAEIALFERILQVILKNSAQSSANNNNNTRIAGAKSSSNFPTRTSTGNVQSSESSASELSTTNRSQRDEAQS